MLNGSILNTQTGQISFQFPTGLADSATNWPTNFADNVIGTIDAGAPSGLSLGNQGFNSFSDNAGWNTGSANPVVLDLTGKGINITQLGSSSQFMDMTGNGYQNRTAWAGAGNGVLVLDLNGTGKIDSPADFQFTAWDPTATSDMQALRDVFDTNHDGKLDAGDADFNAFKVLVTNADGTTTLETLAQLGITSINLTTDNTDEVLADGSRIVGETTYTTSSAQCRR